VLRQYGLRLGNRHPLSLQRLLRAEPQAYETPPVRSHSGTACHQQQDEEDVPHFGSARDGMAATHALKQAARSKVAGVLSFTWMRFSLVAQL